MILTAHDAHCFAQLGSLSVSYPPKDIHTVALQATPENIGALSLELHAELRYNGAGLPFVVFRAKRGTDEDPQEPASVPVRVGDWLVVLWDELHVFRDFEFKSTFQINAIGAHHELSVDHSPLTDEQRFELREQEMRRNMGPTAISVLPDEVP